MEGSIGQMSVIIIPVRAERNPFWKFEGDWTAEDIATVEAVMHKHQHKQQKLFSQPQTWLLVCRKYGRDKDYHAVQGGEVALYSDTAAELAEKIDKYCITGKVDATMVWSEDAVMAEEERDMDEWLQQLKAIRTDDQKKLQVEKEKAEKTKQEQAEALLHRSEAHNLLRQVQKVLLNGEGMIRVLDEIEEYDLALALFWQGSVSTARKPTRSDEGYSYILVGVREDALFVNDEKLPDFRVETLKASLLKACKHPARNDRRIK